MTNIAVTPISTITSTVSGINGMVSSPSQGTVAFGNGGAVFSWNGTSYNPAYGAPVWTVQSSGVTTDLLGGCWSPTFQKFVLCGRDGTILTSPSGGYWASATAITSADLYSVAENSGVLLAVGAGGVALSSVDAINWLPKSVPEPLIAQKLVLAVPKGVG